MAFKDITKPRIITFLALPFITSIIFWGFLTYFFWDRLTSLGIAFFQLNFIQAAVHFFSDSITITDTLFILFTKLFFILSVVVPMTLISALLFTSIFLVPVIVEEIRKTDFPTFVKKPRHIFLGTMASLILSLKYILSWIVTIPLWIILPGGNVIVPFILLSWFNSRLFLREVMIEIASEEETKVFLKNEAKQIWMIGFLTSCFYMIPIVNFIAPVITAAVFSRYCLNYCARHSARGLH